MILSNRFRTIAALACVVLGCVLDAAAQSECLVFDYGSNRVARFRYANAKPLDAFITTGFGPIDGPEYGVLRDGALFVSAVNSHNILRYNAATGEYLNAFVPSGLGGLTYPYQFAFGPDGDLYVASHGTDSVKRYNGQTGAYVSDAVGISSPLGLAFGPGGDMFVTSYYTHTLNRYTFGGPDGAWVLAKSYSLPDSGATYPYFLTLDGAGNLYIPCVGSDSVLRLKPDNSLGAFIQPGEGGIDAPTSVTIDPKGDFLVTAYAGNAGVYRFDQSGQSLGQKITGTAGGMVGNLQSVLFLPDAQDNCSADFDGNGLLDLFDFLAFVNAFNAGC